MIWLKLIEEGDYYTVHSNSDIVVEALFGGFEKDKVSGEEELLEIINDLTKVNWIKDGDKYVLAPYSKPLEFPIKLHRKPSNSKLKLCPPSYTNGFTVYPKDSGIKSNYVLDCSDDYIIGFGGSTYIIPQGMTESDIRRLILECKSDCYVVRKNKWCAMTI